MLRTVLITLAACEFGLLVLVGCNDGGSSRRTVRPLPARTDTDTAVGDKKPADAKPARQGGSDAHSGSPKPQPARAAEAGKKTEESTTQPAEKPRSSDPPPPKIPDYVTVIERVDDRAAVKVSGQTRGRSRLLIDTRNVRRLRITRAKLAFSPNRSIALRLDGQVFELRANTDVVEMQRSRNGDWSPVAVKKKP